MPPGFADLETDFPVSELVASQNLRDEAMRWDGTKTTEGRLAAAVHRFEDKASRWRLRAAELRARAYDTQNAQARAAMHQAADGWEMMAIGAERHASKLNVQRHKAVL